MTQASDFTDEMGLDRLFVLGAGFSRSAGLPLGPELWRLVHARASGQGGRAGRYDRDLETYIKYRLMCDGLRLEPADVDFEDFLAFLDIEHYLGLAGSDTWSSDGNETQCVVKSLIGEILVERTPARDALPQVYYDFAEQLTRGDHVLSFNYDTVLERALEHVGREYRLFASRFTEVRKGIGYSDSSNDEVVLLKLHGSVDWFDRTHCTEWERECAQYGPVKGRPRQPRPQIP